MVPEKIPKMEFELLYLSELTRKKIKPLSRWEKPLTRQQRRWLQRNGLKTDNITRKTGNGSRISETIFSQSDRYLKYYRKKFDGTSLTKDPDFVQTEGFLFGYPACCVSQFIRRPYMKNGLHPEDQRILFHWACPSCRTTADLIPYYQKIYQEVSEWHQAAKSTENRHRKQPSLRWSLAAALSLFLTTGSLSGQIIPDSSHYIPVANDLDMDFLSDAEETFTGMNIFYSYTMPGITDNIYWTSRFKAIIDLLPTTPQADRPYRQDYPAFGQETCQKCGALVNMGFVRLVNPMRQIEMDIPYIGLHFLEYHCFSFDGSIHSSRVDVSLLKKILFPYDSPHLLNVSGDTDADGLTDAEEDSLYFDSNNPDTNGDGVPDGAEVAEQLTRLLPLLKDSLDGVHSHFTYWPMFGSENCTVCGAELNMGHIEFQNPENGKTYQIHFNGLHALAHGSFAYDGSTWPNQRADAVELYRTMKTHMLHIANDSDNDGLRDDEESRFGYDPYKMDSDNDGICDGMELALQMHTIIAGLPKQVVPVGPYILEYQTWGHWNCLLCGEAVNMGFMELHNPAVSQDPVIITYYAYHFLKQGSFAHEGRIDFGQWIEGRLDPLQLGQYLEFPMKIPADSPDSRRLTFQLYQNYPNPFNNETIIKFLLRRKGSVELSVFDIAGKPVKILVSGNLVAGEHKVSWNGKDEKGRALASGFYIYELRTAQGRITKKMLLLK